MSGNEEQHKCLAAHRSTLELPLMVSCILKVGKVRFHTCLFYHLCLLESMRNNSILFRSIIGIYKTRNSFMGPKLTYSCS